MEQAAGTAAGKLSRKLSAHSSAGTPEVRLFTLKAGRRDIFPPARPHHLNFIDSTTKWGRYQMPETMWDISHSNYHKHHSRVLVCSTRMVRGDPRVSESVLPGSPKLPALKEPAQSMDLWPKQALQIHLSSIYTIVGFWSWLAHQENNI